MEQKMAKATGLTAQQKQLLDLAIQEPYFINTFYLSGGTALSSWYFHHRESFDLDFFSLVPFDYDRIARWFRHNEGTIGYSSLIIDEDYGFMTIRLRYPDRTLLQIDFNHYSHKKLKQGLRWRGLEIDSLLDIMVNKIHTIATLPRTRDYVDVYTILKNTKWKLRDLLPNTNKKFKEQIDPLQLAKNFCKVSEYTDLPKMLVPFDRKEMEHFFLSEAKKLESEIFA